MQRMVANDLVLFVPGLALQQLVCLHITGIPNLQCTVFAQQQTPEELLRDMQTLPTISKDLDMGRRENNSWKAP